MLLVFSLVSQPGLLGLFGPRAMPMGTGDRGGIMRGIPCFVRTAWCNHLIQLTPDELRVQSMIGLGTMGPMTTAARGGYAVGSAAALRALSFRFWAWAVDQQRSEASKAAAT